MVGVEQVIFYSLEHFYINVFKMVRDTYKVTANDYSKVDMDIRLAPKIIDLGRH